MLPLLGEKKLNKGEAACGREGEITFLVKVGLVGTKWSYRRGVYKTLRVSLAAARLVVFT